MRFQLVYVGKLPSSGNKPKPADAVRIRDVIHAQMAELWRVHRSLRRLRRTSIVKRDPSIQYLGTYESPFDVERDVDAYPADPNNNEVDLSAPINFGARSYVPLVRRSLDLNCAISISFLRQEDPGDVVLQGGDLDGRIKTLFDALTMPKKEVELHYPSAQDLTYCLLESDTLVSDFEVSTGRLLVPESTHPHEVHLLIEVNVNVLRVGNWNLPLLCH